MCRLLNVPWTFFIQNNVQIKRRRLALLKCCLIVWLPSLIMRSLSLSLSLLQSSDQLRWLFARVSGCSKWLLSWANFLVCRRSAEGEQKGTGDSTWTWLKFRIWSLLVDSELLKFAEHTIRPIYLANGIRLMASPGCWVERVESQTVLGLLKIMRSTALLLSCT